MKTFPPLPAGLRYAENSYEEAGFAARRGIIPRRWAGDPAVAREALEALKPKPHKDRRYWSTFGKELESFIETFEDQIAEDETGDVEIVDEDELFARLIGEGHE